jgi:hypothetical protein
VEDALCFVVMSTSGVAFDTDCVDVARTGAGGATEACVVLAACALRYARALRAVERVGLSTARDAECCACTTLFRFDIGALLVERESAVAVVLALVSLVGSTVGLVSPAAGTGSVVAGDGFVVAGAGSVGTGCACWAKTGVEDSARAATIAGRALIRA